MGAGRLDFVQVGVGIVQCLELCQQSYRGFLADAAHAGHIVAGVTQQRFVIHNLIGAHPELLFDQCLVVNNDVVKSLSAGQDFYAWVDQLQGIAVSGHNHHVQALAASPSCQRSQHIIGLKVLRCKDWHPQRADQILDTC